MRPSTTLAGTSSRPFVSGLRFDRLSFETRLRTCAEPARVAVRELGRDDDRARVLRPARRRCVRPWAALRSARLDDRVSPPDIRSGLARAGGCGAIARPAERRGVRRRHFAPAAAFQGRQRAGRFDRHEFGAMRFDPQPHHGVDRQRDRRGPRPERQAAARSRGELGRAALRVRPAKLANEAGGSRANAALRR